MGNAPHASLPHGPAAPIVQAGPHAPNPHAPPPLRLALLGISSSLSAAAIAIPAAPLPDAGLLRLCAGLHDADARSHAAPDDGAEWKVWLDRRWEFSNQIEGMTPRTDDGRRAKARVALVLMEEAADFANEYERFVLVALRKLVAGGAA